MKLVESSVSIIEQGDNIFKHIEKCARVCYKSEDKITDRSWKPLIQKLVGNGHWSMLEHGTVYLTISEEWRNFVHDYGIIEPIIGYIFRSPYTHIVEFKGVYYITTNARVVLEAYGEKSYFEYLVQFIEGDGRNFHIGEVTPYHIKRVTVKWIISRAIANEFVRHRVFSFAQESTRFVNYHNKGIEFIIPEWYKEWDEAEAVGMRDFSTQYLNKQVWEDHLSQSEKSYNFLLEFSKSTKGLSPQFARGVLPLDLKTELVMTGSMDQWGRFIELRGATSNSHPDAKFIVEELNKVLYK